jgi:hypothetical protein
MSSKDSVSQNIKASLTAVTLIALTGGFRVINAALDNLFGLTREAVNTILPAQLTNGLITLHIIDQVLDIDLHRWTPVRGGNMGWHQYTISSNSMTPESNKSVLNYLGFLAIFREMMRSTPIELPHDTIQLSLIFSLQ